MLLSMPARCLRRKQSKVHSCSGIRVSVRGSLHAVEGMPMQSENMGNEARCNALAACGQMIRVTAIPLYNSE